NRSGIYVMNGDGSNPRRLKETGPSDDPPSWSPNGRELAIGSADYQIYAMDSYGRHRHRLTSNPVSGQQAVIDDGGTIWSPNGRRIVFESDRDTYSSDWSNRSIDFFEIYVMDAKGHNQHALTHP